MKGIEEIVDRCEWQGDCLVWTGGTTNGYGAVMWGGLNRKAHRIIYAHTVGEIPPGIIVRHSCDNPPCVNPAHLILGTHADNANDRKVRGRHPYPQREWTHCHRGHERNEENTRITVAGAKECIPCRRGIRNGTYTPGIWR